jgi:hypothetical protein
MSKALQVCMLLSMFWAPAALAQGVVGLPGAHRDVFVAVRGLVPSGGTVTGVRFFSNDATVFPEVCLMEEARGGRLPSPGRVLRSVATPAGRAGVVEVLWEPYTTTVDQHLWAVIRFPDDAPIHGRGIGGGPGIGWRPGRVLEGERSLFSVAGHLNEFSPAFDLSLVIAEASSANKSVPEVPEGSHEQTSKLRVLSVRAARVDRVVFSLEVGVGPLDVELFDVAGRRVRTLLAESAQAGTRAMVWEGRDERGLEVPSGVYFYAARQGATVRSGKFVRIR